MQGFAQPEDQFPPASAEDKGAETKRSSANGAVGAVRAAGGPSHWGSALEETELDSALQLLVERAQYITGATGTALALPQGEEMICRASAGASAPAVGARLQVRSGLTGESIARRQLLRCDNAESDPRVNLEACQALGIASIVVLPLLRRSGEVRGLFELFSDHPYAFEERDLIALERMADLTLTALDLAERRPNSAAAPTPRGETGKPAELLPELLSELSTASGAQSTAMGLYDPGDLSLDSPLQEESATPAIEPAEPPVNLEPGPAPIPEAMLRVQKCAACGFPVSAGRTLCLDCDKKEVEREAEKDRREPRPDASFDLGGDSQRDSMGDSPSESAAGPAAPMPEEFVPAFLANSMPPKESWLAKHVNLLAIIVLILGVLVAVVVLK
jgi:putative methionine-R-sulfoxide reductase with GAF domain